jgi:lipopolysaccharide transport system permease protein
MIRSFAVVRVSNSTPVRIVILMIKFRYYVGLVSSEPDRSNAEFMSQKAAVNYETGIQPTIIEPGRKGALTGFREVWEQRELLLFLAIRSIKVRYQQTVLGASWAILQPFMTMVVFSLFFGRLAQIPSDGIPYPIFAYTALVPWTFFASSLTQTAQSLVGNTNLITKVYFPRLVIPLSSVLSAIVDFVLAFIVLIGMIIFFIAIEPSPTIELLIPVLPYATPAFHYGIAVTANIIFLPFFFLLGLMTAVGVGLWFSAMNVQFRDIRYTIPFIVQFWLFATPIAYPSSLLSESWRVVYGVNPMVGVVEGFRWALLGTDTRPGPIIVVSTIVALLIMFSGFWYFKRMEDTFADVV